jgi:hypothetical protein
VAEVLVNTHVVAHPVGRGRHLCVQGQRLAAVVGAVLVEQAEELLFEAVDGWISPGSCGLKQGQH